MILQDIIQNYDKYREITPKVVILLIIWGVSEVAHSFSRLSDVAMMYVLIISACIVGLWLFIEYIGKADNIVWAEANEAIKGIDKATQTRIYEGIQDIKFIDEFVDDESEMLRRSKINSVALGALTPSIYHNQHCRRIKETSTDSSDRNNGSGYLRYKQNLVIRAFNKNAQRSKYMKMISRRLSKGTFDDLVKSYIHNLFINIVGPVLYESCRTKIRYYSEILTRKDLSRTFRKITQSKIDKNNEYLIILHDMMNSTSIIDSASCHNALSSNISSILLDTPMPKSKKVAMPEIELKNGAKEDMESSIVEITRAKNGTSTNTRKKSAK